MQSNHVLRQVFYWCSLVNLECPFSRFLRVQVYANGTIATIAGVAGRSFYAGEGLSARSANLSLPTAVTPYLGGFAINCRGTNRIMMLWPNATLTTLAGSGLSLSCASLAGDSGPATAASLCTQWGTLAADPAGLGGGLVFADQGFSVVRRVLPNGFIVRVAGSGIPGFSGELRLRVSSPKL